MPVEKSSSLIGKTMFRINARQKRLSIFFHFIVVFGLLGFLVLILPKAGFPLDKFAIDPDRSYIVFRVKYLGITFVDGKFTHAMGRYISPNDESGKVEIDVRVRVMDIDTGNVARDERFQSPDFFHAEKYPWITFKSVSIVPLDAVSFRVAGDLSFHGVTRSIEMEAFKTGAGSDEQGQTRAGFQSTFTIRRSEYGMKKLMGGFGDQVELTVCVEGVRNS